MSSKIYPIKLYFRQPSILIFTIISLVINLITWGWLLWYIRPQEELLFLHYNILFGVDFIGEWWRVFYVPTTGFVILLTNFLLGWLLFHKDKFVAKLLLSLSVYCQIVLFIVATILVFLNI